MNPYSFIKSQNDRLLGTIYSVIYDSQEYYSIVSDDEGEAYIFQSSDDFKVIHSTITDLIEG